MVRRKADSKVVLLVDMMDRIKAGVRDKMSADARVVW